MATTMTVFEGVASLQTLSLRSIGLFVESVALDVISKSTINANEGRRTFGDFRFIAKPVPRGKTASLDERTQKTLESLKNFLTTKIPHSLYNKVAEEVFRFVERRARKMPSFKEETVLRRLKEAVLNPELRSLDFSQWKSLEISLYENLHKLSGLENLKLNFSTGYLESADFIDYVSESLSAMKNLKSLSFCGDCKEVLVETIADHCPAIQCLDLTVSRSVISPSIPHLLRCQNLRELKLSGTCITNDGLAQLIAGLPNLRDIGFCNNFGDVVDCLYQEYPTSGPFELRRIGALNLLDKQRRFLDMFPKVEQVTLIGQRSDLTDLIALKNLVDLKLQCRKNLGQSFEQLLKAKGDNIKGLHLVDVQNFTFMDLFYIGVYCPNLKSFKLNQGNYRKEPRIPCTSVKFCIWPFSKLETIFWNGNLCFLRYVLKCAFNIRCIDLDTPITHRFVEKVLSENTMRQLENLYIPSTSVFDLSTVELLLANCKNVKIVSKLRGQDIERTMVDTLIRRALSQYMNRTG